MTEQRMFYRGICIGGPYAGDFAESRFPKGFLLVDKVNNQCWVYDWQPNMEFFKVRQEEPMQVSLEGRMRAANEFTYDVVALGGE